MLLFYLVYPLLWLLARLPTGLLYILANGAAWLLEHAIRYRRAVVYSNLRNSFPDKSDTEIKIIAHDFYRHFADVIVENIKAATISVAELQERIEVPNVREIFDPYYEQKRNVVIVMGHCGAWQWAGFLVQSLIRQRLYAFYSPLTNPHFDSYIRLTRGRLGMELVSVRNYLRHIKNDHNKESNLNVFLFDQSPTHSRNIYWTQFLNQDTAFYLGAAHFALEQDCAVLFAQVKYLSRGHYVTTFTDVAKDLTSMSTDGIIESCVRLLEEQIIETPADWLWSHRRWKRKRTREEQIPNLLSKY